MKTTVLYLVISVVLLSSCKMTMKLSVPEAFKEQATRQHVYGARKKLMTVDNFSTSKIKRGWHSTYPGWSRGFFLENLFLNSIGLQKNERVVKEKDNFRYTITDGKNNMLVFGKERKSTRSLEYKLLESKSILNSFSQIQKSQYIFAAMLVPDSVQGAKSWDLVLSNGYDREKSGDKSLFPIIRPDDSGIATNGTDTLFIKPISLREAEGPNGKKGKLLFKVLAGYELSTPDGVVAIVDLVALDVWMYKELEPADRLTIAAIATALFARRVNDTKW